MVPAPWSSSVATASTSWSPRSMPVYHIHLNKTDLRSPAAAACWVGGGVRCAHTGGVLPINPINITTAATVEPFCILVSYFGDHVFEVNIAAGIALPNGCVAVGIQFQYSRGHHPRLQQHSGILHRDLVVESVALAPKFLDHMHVVGMEISASIEPRGVVEANRVNDERVALPMSHGIPVKAHVLRPHRIVPAAVRRNDPEIIRLRAGSGSRIKEDHFIGSLNDLRGGAHAWHAVRLALKKWIHGIRVSIQVLNFIPELRLIERPVGIHSSRELAVDGLIRLIATPLLIRSTSAGWKVRYDIAVVLGCAPRSGAAVPHPAQVGMARFLSPCREHHARCDRDQCAKTNAQESMLHVCRLLTKRVA